MTMFNQNKPNEKFKDLPTNFKNATTREEVEFENWCWKATYTPNKEAISSFQDSIKRDGRVTEGIKCETLFQFDADTCLHHNIGEIDKSRLFVFTIYNFDDPTIRFDFIIRKGMKIFLMYRTTLIGWSGEKLRCPVFGYSKGKNQFYMLILPDGRTLVSSEDNFDLPEYLLHKV